MNLLSEAIKQGAKLRPQSFGGAFKPVKPGSDEIASCAMGAAYEVTFGLPKSSRWNFSENLHGAFPILYKPAKLPPVEHAAVGYAADESIPLAEAITVLNDQLHWPREQIADFVAGYEDMLEVRQWGRSEDEAA